MLDLLKFSVIGVITSKLDLLNIILRYTFLNLDRPVFREALISLEPQLSNSQRTDLPHICIVVLFGYIHSQEQMLTCRVMENYLN